MPLGTITKRINGQPEYNFGKISSSGCRSNRENVVEIVIFFFFSFFLCFFSRI
jgi:hypothetical protein